MNAITPVAKVLSTNPLKSSAPLGAALAYLGIEGAVPLFHGSQGCTAFALVLLVRHFKEAIPLQTTAMNEVSTILGGADHVEEALLNLKKRMNPKLVGICSTALTETRGEDFVGDLRLILTRRAEDLAGTDVVFASTPDFNGALEEGWSKAVTAVIDTLVPEGQADTRLQTINVLPGQHLTPGDVEAVKDMIEQFGLEAVVLPDVSLSLDGIATGAWSATTYGGTTVDDIRKMGRSAATIAIGEHMRAPARLLEERTGVPSIVFDTLTGLESCDRLMVELAQIGECSVPMRLRRERDRLVDAMLDGHFHFAGRNIAIAAEPDLLYAMASLFHDLGATISAAVTTTGASSAVGRVPAKLIVGDLCDLERRAHDADLIATHSHGRQAAEHLHIPHLRIGFPIFDRLGAAYRTSVGYAGTRSLIFEAANAFQAAHHHPTPETLNPFRNRKEPV
jgi:nitrogenase molybdenum-iron protein NifN